MLNNIIVLHFREDWDMIDELKGLLIKVMIWLQNLEERL